MSNPSLTGQYAAGSPTDNRGPALLGVTSTFTALSAVAVGLRLFVRLLILKSPGLDDASIVLSLVSLELGLGCSLLMFAGAHYRCSNILGVVYTTWVRAKRVFPFIGANSWGNQMELGRDRRLLHQFNLQQDLNRPVLPTNFGQSADQSQLGLLVCFDGHGVHHGHPWCWLCQWPMSTHLQGLGQPHSREMSRQHQRQHR